MKPSDFKMPHLRTKGLSVINDRVCSLAKHVTPGFPFIFPEWNHPEIFGNSNPVKIEFCSGNGQWIAQRAVEDPSSNWVAVEMKYGRTRKIWSKIKNLELNNLFVVNGEGAAASQLYFPKNSVQEIYINFPDPWPKRHHERHRIVKTSFVKIMADLLNEKGTVTIVTDDTFYSEWTLKTFKDSPDFISCLPYPHSTTDWQDYGSSFFEALWREKGKTIIYHKFQKPLKTC